MGGIVKPEEVGSISFVFFDMHIVIIIFSSITFTRYFKTAVLNMV